MGRARPPRRNLAAEGQALEIEEARCALQIGQPVGRHRGQPIELGPASDAPAQHVDQIGIVLLEHAEEGGDVAADVVDHLDAGTRGAAQEDPAHPDKRLSIAVMGRRLDQRTNPPREIALAALITSSGRDGRHRI